MWPPRQHEIISMSSRVFNKYEMNMAVQTRRMVTQTTPDILQ